MTKVIEDIELLKKLAPYLKDIETEYTYYNEYGYEHLFLRAFTYETEGDYWCAAHAIADTKMCDKIKTLTLEEAIELLPVCINDYFLGFNKISVWYQSESEAEGIECLNIVPGKTLLEAIEKMLEYLIDNKLLG